MNELINELPLVQIEKKQPKESRKEKAHKRRQEILKLMHVLGPYRLPVKELAQQWGVNHTQIYKDMREIVNSLPNPIANSISRKLNMSITRGLEKAHSLMNSQDNKDVAAGISALTNLVRCYTDFLEAYGYKPKTPDMVEIQHSVPNEIQLLAQAYQDWLTKKKEAKNANPEKPAITS